MIGTAREETESGGLYVESHQKRDLVCRLVDEMERTVDSNWEGENIESLEGIQGFEMNMDADI